MLDRQPVYPRLIRLPRWAAHRKIALAIVGAVLAGTWIAGRFYEVGPLTPDRWTDGVTQISARRFIPGQVGPREMRGPRHCDLGGSTFIRFGAGTYVRGGLDPSIAVEGTYEPDARLPRNAAPTPWHRGKRHLWLDPADQMPDGGHRSIYIVTDGRAERWPRTYWGCM